VLNLQGIIENINGNQYFITWQGATQAVPCTKHAFQLWVDGDEVQRRNFSRIAAPAAAAMSPVASPNALNGQEDEGGRSEAGSVDAGTRDNGLDPEDMSDEAGDGDEAQPVAPTAGADGER
jgi:hypothetical protein